MHPGTTCLDTSTATPEGRQQPFDVTHRIVLAIAVPMTFAYVSTPLLGLTDTAVLGQFGRAADLAGLGVAAVIFDLVFSLISFIRTSTTGLVAQAFGRNDRGEEEAVFWRAVISGIAGGVSLVILSPLILYAGLAVIGPEPAAAAVATTYFYIRILSSPVRLINDALLGYALGKGRGTLGLLLQTVLNGTNIALSVFLGLVLGYGVSGVAWATVISEIVAAAAGFLIVLPAFKGQQRPSMKRLFERDKLIALFALNRDITIRSLLLVASFVLLTRAGANISTVVLAANAVLMNFFMVAAFFLDGMAAAAEQLAGRSIGAQNLMAFRKSIRLTALWSFALSGFLAAAFLLSGSSVIAFLTTAETVRAAAVEYLPWMALTGITGALAFQMDGIYIGATWSKEMRNMMILSFVGYVIALEVLTPLLGNHGVWLSLNLFLFLRGVTLAAATPRQIRQSFLSAH
jgi:multidrug resistance protein, MATE family